MYYFKDYTIDGLTLRNTTGRLSVVSSILVQWRGGGGGGGGVKRSVGDQLSKYEFKLSKYEFKSI